VDFVPKSGMNNVNDRKIEEAVLEIMLSGKYNEEIGLINERVYPSGHASGDHFHLSLDTNVEYSNFGFIDMNGISYKDVVKKGSNLSWGNGGPYPKKIKNIIDGKKEEVKKQVELEKERLRLEKEKLRLDNIFLPLKNENLTSKEYCETLIKIKNENPNDIDKIPTELLFRDSDIGKTITFCENILDPIVPLEPIGIQSLKLDTRNLDDEIEKFEKQMEELKSLESLSTLQLLKKRKELKKIPSKQMLVYRINDILKQRY